MHNDGIVYFPFPCWVERAGSSSRTTSTPTTACCSPTAWPTGTPRRRRKSQAAHGVSDHRGAARRPARWRVRAAVALRPPHHGVDPDRHRRARPPGHAAAEDGGRSDRHARARHAQQLRHGLHAVGHLPRLRGELQRVLPQDDAPERRSRRATASPRPAGTCGTRPTPASTLDVEPNEPNRFGWVTEIDPFEPGVDAGEAHRARPAEARRSVGRGDRRRAGRRLHGRRRALRVHLPLRLRPSRGRRRSAGRRHPLDDGILYVARFNADGTGDWLPLTTDNPALAGFASQADILINTRAAADAVGATKMDRPEWIDVIDSQEGGLRHPHQQHQRGTGTNPASTPPTPAPTTCTATSCAGATRTTSATRSSSGRSSPWPATRPSPRTGRRSSATSTARPTASTSPRAGGCGSRPTCRSSHHRHRRLRRVRQQPDAVRRSDHEGDPAVPGRPEPVRDHRGASHPGRADACSSASSTRASAPTARPATPPTRSSSARGPTVPPAAGPAPALLVITKDDGGVIGT